MALNESTNSDSTQLIMSGKKKETTDQGAVLMIKDDMDESKTKYTVTNETKNSVACKVLMLDGTDFKVNIPKNSIGQVLFFKACEHLSLLEKEYFAITFKESNETKVWLQNDKPIAKQLNKSKWDFSFEVKFYPQDPCMLKEELTRYQMYLQVRVDILSGKLPCSFVTNSLLGSYACQSQLGDWDPTEHDQGFEYIRSIKFCPGQNDELIERVAELHKNNRGMEAAEAEYMYLENAKSMALYGVHLVTAKDESHSQVSLGICADGLLVYKDRIRLHRYVWAKIMKIAYKRNIFYIHVRPNTPKEPIPVVQYRLLNYKTAKRTWRLAVEHHTFFRLKDPIEAGRNLFMRRGHFTGVTQFQAGQAAEKIKRESTNFAREYHTMGRGGLDSKVDFGYNSQTMTVDRTEETISVDQTTRTLDRGNKKNKPSLHSVGDFENQENMIPIYDDDGNLLAYKGGNIAVGTPNEVFMTSPRQNYSDDPHYGKDGPHVTMSAGVNDFTGMTYSKTPYPTGPGTMTPGGGPGLNSTFNRSNPNSPSYGLNDDFQRQVTTGSRSPGGYLQDGGTGVDRSNAYLNPGAAFQVNINQGYDQDGTSHPGSHQDDHLRQQMNGVGGPLAGEAGWGPYSTTNQTRTLTRMYTDSDGTVVTETRVEKNGVIETHVEKRKTTTIDVEEDDYDKMLADAIRNVTDMNPDLSVEKIEITKGD